MPELIHEGQNHDIGIRYASWRTALVASTLLTLGLHVYLEHAGDGHGPRIAVSDVHHLDGISERDVPLGAGHPTEISVEDNRPAKTTSTVEESSEKILAPYARNYATDPAVEQIDHPGAQSLHDTLTALHNAKKSGISMIYLRVQGHASAEDNLANADAGLTTPNQLNVDLANARRDAFLDYLTANSLLPPYVMVEKVAGAEGTVQPEEVQQLDILAQTYHFDSLSQMIDAWSTGQAVPAAVNQILTATLAQDRAVTAEILVDRQVVLPGGPRTITEKVCAIPVQPTITRSEHLEPWKVTLPWFIPFAVGLPFIRRRRRDGREEDPILGSEPLQPLPRIPVLPDREARFMQEYRMLTGGSMGKTELPLGAAAQPKTPAFIGPTEPTVPTSEAVNEVPKPTRPSPETPQETDRSISERRRKWPWLLIPAGVLLAGGAVSLKSCDGHSSKTAQPTPTTMPCDPSLPKVNQPIDSNGGKTIKVVDGRTVSVSYAPAPGANLSGN